MTEFKFLFVGFCQRNKRAMVLAYVAKTASEALATCQRLNPDFRIDNWDLADHLV